MPCYQVNLMSVEFKAENIGLLELAVKALGWTFNNDTAYNSSIVQVFDGRSWMKLRIDGRESIVEKSKLPLVNKLKRKYSELAIMEAAKLKRWSIRKLSEHKMLAVR
jgi:hypothetical protein